LWLALVVMSVMFVAPILLQGEPRYPASEWRRALLWAGLERVSGSDEGDEVECVHGPPPVLCGLDQLERHRDPGSP
jgi:hypothetical protein